MGRTGRPDAHFNPRTPCGVRREKPCKLCIFLLFQSTHPVRGATQGVLINLAEKNISIHAPRAGCDVGSGNIWLATNTISIHAPRAGCDASQIGVEPQIEEISIHAPRAGCDNPSMRLQWQGSDFNPRTPCGVRLKDIAKELLKDKFQSTHPVRGATPEHRKTEPQNCDFNPRTPCGVRLILEAAYHSL